MKNTKSFLQIIRTICFLAVFISCQLKEPEYKRYWGGELKETNLYGQSIVISKSDNELILQDETGWFEQTYYKPIVRHYNVGDTLYIKPQIGKLYPTGTITASDKMKLDSIDTKAVFHIKASYWYECQWKVSFTNNNWKTEEEIKKTFDISDIMGYDDVVCQLKIFRTEQDAVAFAKKYKTYKDCREYNDSVFNEYQRLLKYRKAHPVKAKQTETENCEDEKGKEVIIY